MNYPWDSGFTQDPFGSGGIDNNWNFPWWFGDWGFGGGWGGGPVGGGSGWPGGGAGGGSQAPPSTTQAPPEEDVGYPSPGVGQVDPQMPEGLTQDVWDWFKTNFPDLWRTATYNDVLDRWYGATTKPPGGGLKPPTDPGRGTGPPEEPNPAAVGGSNPTTFVNPFNPWGANLSPYPPGGTVPAGQGGEFSWADPSIPGPGGGYNLSPPERPTIDPATGMPIFSVTGTGVMPWDLPPGPGGSFNFGYPTTPVEPFNPWQQVPYNPSPIGPFVLNPPPDVDIPPTSGASTGAPTTKPPETKSPPAGGGGGVGGAGAGPPGPNAPIVGGGVTQSHFGLPAVPQAVVPTLMDFVRALQQPRGAWRQ